MTQLSFFFAVDPEIKFPSITHTIIEGNSITLSCNASGCPTPVITWEKTDSDTFHHVGEIYTFSKVTANDHGEYICSATTQGQTRSERGTLTVLCEYVDHFRRVLSLQISVHSKNAKFRFLYPSSGTCFRTYFNKSGKQGASILSSN